MDKDDKLCDKCGLLPQAPVKPKLPVCKQRKKCCKKDCCETEFAFRKVVIPAALGDDITGKDKPVVGAHTNALVEYEANGAQYMYDSYGVYTKFEVDSAPIDFDDIEDRPKYGGVAMTSSTNIPDVSGAIDDIYGEIAGFEEELEQETVSRESADNNLQSQIDAITVSSDVRDVVGTKAALDSYDTSTLGDNDIIKVLQDESENDATTYYRWNATTRQFTLIGEEGPYYTKSAADTRFQDKLTPGDNIIIEGNVISAVGGGSSVNVVQSIGTSDTDVMSQDAVASCLYGKDRNGVYTKRSVIIGPTSTYQGVYTIGVHLGDINSSYMGNYSIAIGDNSAPADAPKLSNACYRQIAIGGGTNVAHDSSIALGFQATTSRAMELSIGNPNSTRSIANVTDPTLPQDAATKNYVDSAYPIGAVFTSTSTVAPTIAGGTWTSIGSQTIGSSTVYYYERTA